jgi:GntR family transcriptional repressor for pyruvate dehydrogenase complex
MAAIPVRIAPPPTGEPPWTPVRSHSVANQIVAQVRDALFADRLAPGDALGSEKDLAARFGVSRITVRDALRTLETMGIVEIRVGAGGGARIARGNPDRFADALAVQLKLVGVSAHEIMDAQVAVEGRAARLAAEHATADDLVRLEALIEEAQRLTRDPAGFTAAGLAFHLAVAEASHNRALVAQLKALRYVVWPTERPRTTVAIAGRVLKVHRAIVAAIAARDGEAARAAMASHLEGVRSYVAGARSRGAACC